MIYGFVSKSLGSLGFQFIHQKILSASSSATAKLTCIVAAFVLPIFGVGPVLLGAAAASTGNNVDLPFICDPNDVKKGKKVSVVLCFMHH